MVHYYFEAVSADGHIRKKILKARDKKDADKQLRSSGLRPILIEKARVARRKKLERRMEARRIVRKALLSMATFSLVGGVGTYLIVLDLTSVEKIDVKALSRSGMISQSNAIIRADSPEERDFARQVYGHLETNFPEATSGMEIRPGGLMLVYVRLGPGLLRKSDLKPLATTLTRGFQKRFDLSTCFVLIVHGNKTMVEGRFRNGKVDLVD
jgi:hypothetical protein